MTFVDDIHAGFVCDRTNPYRCALGRLVIRVPLLHQRDGIGDGRRTVPRDLNARVDRVFDLSQRYPETETASSLH